LRANFLRGGRHTILECALRAKQPNCRIFYHIIALSNESNDTYLIIPISNYSTRARLYSIIIKIFTMKTSFTDRQVKMCPRPNAARHPQFAHPTVDIKIYTVRTREEYLLTAVNAKQTVLSLALNQSKQNNMHMPIAKAQARLDYDKRYKAEKHIKLYYRCNHKPGSVKRCSRQIPTTSSVHTPVTARLHVTTTAGEDFCNIFCPLC